MSSPQLPLALRWPAQQRFETFVTGDNGAALALVRAAAQGDPAWIFLTGPAGSGKSHLLLAPCARPSAHGRYAQSVSLAKLGSGRAGDIRALGGSDLLAL